MTVAVKEGVYCDEGLGDSGIPQSSGGLSEVGAELVGRREGEVCGRVKWDGTGR